MDVLPVDFLLPDLCAALSSRNCAVLQAPPGAGKTTRVPLALLDQPWLKGQKIIMLEPRRLAARAAARRMADTLGEPVGRTVGYRVRFDSRVSAGTRIEVVTDGLFLRRLQTDPGLDGVGAILFDEFHERSLDVDLSLALAREMQLLREDLRLVVMSATLDAAPVAALLDNAPVLTSEGRTFPVETRYLPAPVQGRIEEAVARQIRQALEEEQGSILVFLPGQGEIRRVQEMLSGLESPSVIFAPLYGDLSQGEQDRAIAPAPAGVRKVVLATAIAETSLTIEGIRIVIDCGLMRIPQFDPRLGMTRLETVPVSQASADQRRGRAGRLEPGICWRLWTGPQHRLLPRFNSPEIREADLAPLALELACQGIRDPRSLVWLDSPPEASLAVARDLLQQLEALDSTGAVTDHGRRMQGLGLHPRLSHMAVKAAGMGLRDMAADTAAVLAERDVVRSVSRTRPADIHWRLQALAGKDRNLPADLSADRGAVAHARKAADQIRSALKSLPGGKGDLETPEGVLVALAYPDRIALRRGGNTGQFLLANGRGAVLAAEDSLAKEGLLAVASVEGGERESRIYLAAPLARKDLERVFGSLIRAEDTIGWSDRDQAVLSRRQLRLGALVLDDAPLREPDPDRVAAALMEGIRQMGLACLPWDRDSIALRGRMAFLQREEPDTGWPDVSDRFLMETLENWLMPYLAGMSRREHLSRLDMGGILRGMLDWSMGQRLDSHAPSHITVPSGSRVALDYSGDVPVLAVRLQEMFGLAETPRVAGGRMPVLIHLLSPAHRPVQVTRDLAGFWANTYAQVRADLRGRYPRHSWPDDPLQATPTRRIKK
ncbi:MAG: ATP-dependent helicase HrpB [Pseudomonadota bacterium]|nr:ATP-dependent helicase HrpB [Pseudomonadota bacterium]